MIRYFFRQYWRYIAMGLAMLTISYFIGACQVKAEGLYTCGYNLKLNGNTSSMTQTAYINSNVNRQIRVGNLLTNGNGITFYSGMKFYTDIIVVTNVNMENYTSTHNGITYSFTNLGYIGNVQGFSENDGIWLIRLIWDATNYSDGGNNDLMYQTFWNDGGFIQDTGSSVNYNGGMRVIGENCGLASNMNVEPQQYGIIIDLLKQENNKLSDLQNKLSTIINYINTTNSKLETINNTIDIVRYGIYDINGNITSQSQQTRIKLDDLITSINNGFQQIIESQQVCNIIDKDNGKTKGYLNTNGNITEDTTHKVTDYIKITNKTKIKLAQSPIDNSRFCFYDINKNLIGNCNRAADYTLNSEITIPNNAKFIRFTIFLTNNVPQFEICDTSQNITNQQNEQIIQGQNDINNNITDSSIDDPSGDLSDMQQNEISNSVISDLLLLPINMFQNIVNAIGGTCNSFSLGTLFGTNLILPCIDIENLIGSSLWGVIDILFCGIFVLSIRKKFVDIFENITSLKDRGNELE